MTIFIIVAVFGGYFIALKRMSDKLAEEIDNDIKPQ